MKTTVFYDPRFVTSRAEPGAFIVHLSDADIARATEAASKRHEEQNGSGRVDPVYRPGEGDRADWEGAIGEVAAQYLFASSDVQMVYSHAEWLERRKNGLTDVRGIEVRTTHGFLDRRRFGCLSDRKQRSLVIHREGTRDKNKPPSTPYALAVILCEPPTAILAKPVYTARVVFPGWCLWDEATTLGTWLPVPDWCRPEAELHAMQSLLMRLDVSHPSEEEMLLAALG